MYISDWLNNIFETIHQNSGNVILATLSGARPAWLSQNMRKYCVLMSCD
ncbi:beta-galactosidase [Carnobacterium iners]|nr:beta-galactosidase [Carnobacterium iners]